MDISYHQLSVTIGAVRRRESFFVRRLDDKLSKVGYTVTGLLPGGILRNAGRFQSRRERSEVVVRKHPQLERRLHAVDPSGNSQPERVSPKKPDRPKGCTPHDRPGCQIQRLTGLDLNSRQRRPSAVSLTVCHGVRALTELVFGQVWAADKWSRRWWFIPTAEEVRQDR